MKKPNLESTITLRLNWNQLQCIETGISCYLRELKERPLTALGRQQREELTAVRDQIDGILEARVAELRAYDEEYQRQHQEPT